MKELLDLKSCCGCGACFNICPNGAISMVENEEGFLEPAINKEKCTNCSLCSKICPVLNTKYENLEKPKSFAFMANDEIRAKSTSGGAFYVLAKYFIENNSYVAGAVWQNDCSVKHIVSNKLEDVEKMRGSKYLQSSTITCYKEIKELLKSDKKVLFSGTPCQVAGLKSFLSKDYENLFCVDIICHGTPSPKVFKQYIKEEYKNSQDEKWLNTNFRDKVEGWIPSLTTTTTTSKVYSKKAVLDSYMNSFLKNLCLRNSCADCHFNKIPRQGDMTIGDAWKIKKTQQKTGRQQRHFCYFIE